MSKRTGCAVAVRRAAQLRQLTSNAAMAVTDDGRPELTNRQARRAAAALARQERTK